MKGNKKLLIIETPKYTDKFNPLPTQIKDHFNRVIGYLNIYNLSNDLVSIELDIDVLNPERFRAFARRQSQKPPIYKIKMPAGISYHLWGTSRVFAYSDDLLPWVEQCRINNEVIKNLNIIREILANYAYFIGSYFVILHEISHIVLGHSDFVMDVESKHLNKFQNEEEQSTQKARLRKTYEAEADRQAGELLLIFFENSLGVNGIGDYLTFPSRLYAYEFYVYALASIFRTLQDLNKGEKAFYPSNSERLYVLIASLYKYFNENLPNERDKIYYHAVKSCLEAGKRLMVLDSYDPLLVIRNAHNLSFIDDVVKEINLRQYQHRLEIISEKQVSN
jgi:hypothetical protein